VCCSVLQYRDSGELVVESVLQCVAVVCSEVWCVAVHCIAVLCGVLQCVAACCSVLQRASNTHPNTLQHTLT